MVLSSAGEHSSFRVSSVSCSLALSLSLPWGSRPQEGREQSNKRDTRVVGSDAQTKRAAATVTGSSTEPCLSPRKQVFCTAKNDISHPARGMRRRGNISRFLRGRERSGAPMCATMANDKDGWKGESPVGRKCQEQQGS
ncbi:hypothetical protein GN956_G1999 [Arapaima gigas]